MSIENYYNCDVCDKISNSNISDYKKLTKEGWIIIEGKDFLIRSNGEYWKEYSDEIVVCSKECLLKYFKI